MRYLTLLIVAGLMAGSLLLDAQPAPGTPDPPPLRQPVFAVCPVEEGGGRTTQLTSVSIDEGPVQLTLFAGGSPAGSIGVSIGESGANVIPVVDVAAVGTVGGLIELPSSASAVASVVRGPASISAESCASSTPPETYLTGGVTADERTFILHLMNPFAGEAVVNLSVTSEVGVESDPSFDSVIVPARSSTLVDFSELIPGRERVSVLVETESGRVMTVGRQSGAADSASWKGVTPFTDWLIPVPTGSASTRVLVGNPLGVEVDFQLDVYSPGGLEEAVLSDVIGPGGEVSVDLGALEGPIQAVRVVSAGPVVATLWSETETSLAVTTGATEATGSWHLPGSLVPGSESGRIVILNPSLEDATVVVRSLRQTGTQRSLPISAESVIELVLGAADGFLVESNVPVVAMLASSSGGSGAMSLGVPLTDE